MDGRRQGRRSARYLPLSYRRGKRKGDDNNRFRSERDHAEGFQRDQDLSGVAREDPVVVLRRGHQAGDHQLPDLQAGTRRSLLREDLRPDHRLGVPLRQVQADEAPRRRLRQVRRRGDQVQGAPRADGTHRAGLAGLHVWFFKGLPSRIGHLLDISLRDLERILYFESYVVIDPGETDLKEKELLSEERYRELRAEHGDVFVARMGAGAIKELLQRVDVDMLAEELRMIMKTETSQIKRQKAAKRLKVVRRVPEARATGRTG